MHTAERNSRHGLIILLTCFCIMLVGVFSVSAQTPVTPITVGENKTGNVTNPTTSVPYALSVAAPQSINIQVLAISQGFAPNFRVIDPGGIIILDASNPGTQTIVQGSPNLASPGTYTIEVFSANNATGQFLISVQPGAPLAPPQALTPGQPVNGSVSSQTTRQAYSFAGLPNDVLALVVRSTSNTSGPVVALRDANTNETLSLSSARLGGISYRILSGQTNYLLEVTHSGGNTLEPFTICLATESGSATCPGGLAPQIIQPTATLFPTSVPPPTQNPTYSPPTINPLGQCMVASARGLAINVRSGPGLNYNIVGSLPPNGTGLVLGRLADNSWYQVSVNGVIGWVSGSVVITGGNCAVVSVIILPTATATVIPPIGTTEVSPGTQTPTPTPTVTSTGGGGGFQPPLNLTLIAPIGTLILVQPTSAPQLNYSLPPNYGSASLTSGFVPDPYTVGITGGGPVNVSYLGGGCSGYATSAPDFSVNYTSGAFPTLRFYFIGNGDSTMIVNTPGGSYYCVDDSFGTLNPTIDFNSPASGRYDIWIGSYAPGAYVGGTLYVTENTGNHP